MPTFQPAGRLLFDCLVEEEEEEEEEALGRPGLRLDLELELELELEKELEKELEFVRFLTKSHIELCWKSSRVESFSTGMWESCWALLRATLCLTIFCSPPSTP